MIDSGFCLSCGTKIESFEKLSSNCCPFCGSKSIPCADNNQVTISVNWHELHILVVWAENYARGLKDNPNALHDIWSIAHRLENQQPSKNKLTLTGEISDLKRIYPKLKTNLPGVE